MRKAIERWLFERFKRLLWLTLPPIGNCRPKGCHLDDIQAGPRGFCCRYCGHRWEAEEVVRWGGYERWVDYQRGSR